MNHVLPHVWCGEKSPLWRVMIKPRWQVWQLVTAPTGGISKTDCEIIHNQNVANIVPCETIHKQDDSEHLYAITLYVPAIR